ncbi:MAG: hypothetical protein IMW89_04405, partial [Ktedonobacteraceae bacterium]|nr:hypothetical protein [Ktedonobacteraceae bacterium]
MKRSTINGFSLYSSVLVLAFLLAGCSLFGFSFGDNGNSTRSTPTPAPTQAPATPTLVTYKGDGYTISYPQDWKVTTKDNAVTFTDPVGITLFRIDTAPNPNGVAPADQFVKFGLSTVKGMVKNFQQENVPATTSVNGVTWSQAAATGDFTQNGQTAKVKAIVMATNHPEHAMATKA